jgi:hypothetical protein
MQPLNTFFAQANRTTPADLEADHENKMQANERKRKKNSFHFLSFIFRNPDFSKGYGRFK